MKILFLKNQITENIDDQVSKFNTFFATRAPEFKFTVDYKDINEPYNIEFTQNGTDGTKHYGTDFHSRAAKYTDGYDAIVFLYQQDDTNYQGGYIVGRKQNPVGTCLYLEQPVNQYFIDIDWLWKTLTHEMMHLIAQALAEKGVHFVDEMDYSYVNGVGISYWNNSDPYSVEGNYSRMLAKFAPYWSILGPTEPLKATLERGLDNGVQTLGVMNCGAFNCRTLELPWKNNQKNISCIPKGTYQVKWQYWFSKFKYTYVIQNIPNRAGIRIHAGNYFFDVQGCILLGDHYSDINHDGEVDILNSRNTIKKFEDLMQKRDFTLIIK